VKKRRYYNTTDSSYTMDAAGHVLGGGETGTFESSHQIRLGVESGKLIDKGEVEEENNSEEVDTRSGVLSGGPQDYEVPPSSDGESNKSGEEAPASESKKKTSTSRRGRAASEEEQS